MPTDPKDLRDWGPRFGPAFAFEDHPNPFLSLLWPFALQSDIYFESIIALCRAALLADRGRSPKTDKAFIRHRGNVITKLRLRVQNPDECIEDSTILAASVLGTIDYVLGDHSAATAHTTALKHMIKLRGGINQNTPLERQFHANISVYESLWSCLPPSTSTSRDTSTRSGTVSWSLSSWDTFTHPGMVISIQHTPTYMTHPFPTEVCKILSTSLPGSAM